MTAILKPAAQAALFRQLRAAEQRGLHPHDVVSILARDRAWFGDHAVAMNEFAAALSSTGSIAAAVRAVPALFTGQVAQLIELAQARGNLAAVLDALADDAQHRDAGRLRLKLVLSWPLALLSIIVFIMIVVAIFVVPQFRDLYAGMLNELPMPTRVVFALVDPQGWVMWAVLVVSVALVIAGQFNWLPARVIGAVADVVSRVPFVERYLVARLASRLTRGMQVAGADAAQHRAWIAHVQASLGPPRLAGVAARIEHALAGGQTLSQACAAEPLLPERVGIYVQLGERMNDLSAPMVQLAEIAGTDEHAALGRFERGLVLATYALLGLLVYTALVAVYLPIFKLGSVF